MAKQTLSNMDIAAFKAATGISEIAVKRNVTKKTIFAINTLADGSTTTMRVQQGIDMSGELQILLVDGDLTDACLTNPGAPLEDVATL